MKTEVKYLMYKGDIIDMHAHIYPQKIADKAVHSIENFYDIYAEGNGTPAMLVENGSRFNVKTFLVHSTATKVEQVTHINDFILAQLRIYPCFVGFGTLHYGMSGEEILKETERIASSGISGVKLHPDCQHFIIDDPIMDNIYSACRDHGLPILIHTGDRRYTNSRPERLAATARRFPNLKFIAAHFGGYSCWDSVKCYEGCDNVWFDTSSSLFKLPAEQAMELIEFFGPERYFFGTDYPLFGYEKEIARFFALPLDDEKQKSILHDNAAAFLGLNG